MPEKIYLDTFVFMDILSDEPENAAKAEVYLNRIKETSAVVSAVLFAELAFHVKRKRGKDAAEEILMYVSSLPLEVVPVTPEISRAAGFVRARYMNKIAKKLTYFDCIHIATALSAGCTKFVTGDRGFKDVKELRMEIY